MKITRTARCLAVLVVLMVLIPMPARAQATGTLLGTVTDLTGAVVANAKVTATRVDTQVSQSTTTNADGAYILPSLAVGTYTVGVESASFKPGSAAGITLDVTQKRQVNFTLVPAAATENVTVVAEMLPLLNTNDGAVAGLVSERQVESLPLNGRSIQNLVMMQPGMAEDTGNMGWLAPQWIANGNRGETIVATLDGADVSDQEMGTPQFWNFNLDAIAEFKVLQNNYSAEYGQGGGSITQMVSKAGGNEFHGSAFEYVRNNAFDARNFFSARVPPLQRHEFGTTIGGPIVKNKTFFYGEYAGLRQLQGFASSMFVPTAAQRQGLVQINGFQYQVPLDPVAQQVLNAYPKENSPNTNGKANLLFTLKAPTTTNQFSVRVDQHFSDKDSLFVRATYANNYQKETDPVAALENRSFSAQNINNPRNYTINEVHVFSPTLLNNGRFTINRQVEGSYPPSQPNPQTTTADGTLSPWGPDTFTTKYVETYFIPEDTVTWIKGKHTLKIGGSLRRGWDNGTGVTSVGPNGQYSFAAGTPLPRTILSTNGGQPILAGTPSPLAIVSLMEGADRYYQRSTAIPGYGPPGGGGVEWGLRVWRMAPYIQDDIRVTPRLTVNLGLRYEYTSVPTEVANRFGGVVDNGPLVGQFVVNRKPLYQPDYLGYSGLNFAPRLGIAYQATRKTVLRGGFATFTNSIPTVYPDQALVNFPIASLGTVNNAPYSMTPLAVALPQLTNLFSGQVIDPKSVPPNTPVNLTPIATALNQGTVAPVITGDYPSAHLKNGYTISANATIEHELPGDMALQVSYILNNGRHLYNSEYPNGYTGAALRYAPYTQVNPGLGEVEIFYNHAISNYNALQAQIRKISNRHGIQFQAGYTWSKDLTDADAVWSAPGSSGAIAPNNPLCVRCEYARATYNIAHRFVANFEYDIPFPWSSGTVGLLTHGWKLLSIFSAQTGFPFSITNPLGTPYGVDSINGGASARPNLLQNPPTNTSMYVPGGTPTFFPTVFFPPDNRANVTQYFSSDGSSPLPAPGNLRRNTFTGPGWWNCDASLIKETKLGEFATLELRAEFFNIFNHTTFTTPSGVLGSPLFGQPVAVTGPLTGQVATATTERQIQFGARIRF